MAKPVPPKKLSFKTKFRFGVQQEDGGEYSAALRLRKPGDEHTVYVEFLGAQHKTPWFAAVCHDVALCKRTYDTSGLRGLHSLAHGASREESNAAERLNFPLSCYTSQAAFWDVLEKGSFGQLVLQVQASNVLAKTLFYGNTWQEGLAEQHRRQQAPQQPKPPAHAAAAARNRSAREEPSKHKPVTGAIKPTRAGEEELEAVHKRRRLTPPVQENQQREQQQEQQAPAAKSPEQQQMPAAKSPEQQPKAPAVSVSVAKATGHVHPAQAALGWQGAAVTAAAAGARDDSTSSSVSEPVLAQMAGRASAAPAPATIASSSNDEQPLLLRRPSGPPLLAACGAVGTTSSQMTAQQQQQQRPTTEPANVWIRASAEFPPGSGKLPMFLKAGPIDKGYYTVSKDAGTVLFAVGYEGDVELRDATSGRSWTVHTHLKNGTQRYLTKTVSFNRDNSLQAHDVLWFQAEGPQKQPPLVLFGIWWYGSQEAEAFTAKLTGSAKSPARGSAAGKAKHGQQAQVPPQQQQQQPVGNAASSSEDNDVPLAQRPAVSPGNNRRRQQQVVVSDDEEEDAPLSTLKSAHKRAALQAAKELFAESNEDGLA